MAAFLIGTMATPARPQEQADTNEESPATVSSPTAPADGVAGEEIFAKLLEHNHLRDTRLQQYSVMRTYLAKNREGKVYAEEIVRMQYRAPDTKTFVTISEKGSRVVRSRVFKGLMKSEVEAAGRSHRDSSITPANYTFRMVGAENTEECHCFVVQAAPKRKDKYLFAGRIWIDARDFAVVKIAGHPAKNPSFWIKRVDFIRSYQKIGEFWLPSKDETSVEMKIFGEKVLIIDHGNYSINRGNALEQQAQGPAGAGLASNFSGQAGQTVPGETPRGSSE